MEAYPFRLDFGRGIGLKSRPTRSQIRPCERVLKDVHVMRVIDDFSKALQGTGVTGVYRALVNQTLRRYAHAQFIEHPSRGPRQVG